MNILYTHDISRDVLPADLRREDGGGKVFFLADENTARLCLPRLGDISPERTVVIPSGDDHKTLQTLRLVWEALQRGGATRRSTLVCVGGGMVTDLGGFAAATFKRGMDFVNVPTTLLAMVDAAVGGKTGVNLGGLKNEVGVFRDAVRVCIDTEFLRTLDDENLRSGFAEMLKHALLDGEAMWASHVNFNLSEPDLEALQAMVRQSIEVKSRIVAQDPTERGLRKALNLGHTTGHALETFALRAGKPRLHGYCVAWGLVCALYLSTTLLGFPTARLRQTVGFVRRYYGVPDISCKDYETLYGIMLHDKKNAAGHLNMTLLRAVGDIALDQQPSREAVFDALDFLREG
ncbi:MAG: 3-dehydroquinate synthase [Alloprevotella sp.]|nr:3-dehydroquinate synthase [Alloprevotella sp.]